MKLRVLAMVLAGGEGTRLSPLTSERSKPAVPFGGRYRIVDFVLSNLLNSGIHSIYLLVQYKSQSLIEHIHNAWVLSPIIPEQFLRIVPPQMREGPEWFLGTADAVYQNLNLIETHTPDLVLVFGADHIYRMDVQQMMDYHRERQADVTVAALPVPVAEASSFGVLETQDDGRIVRFHEKPKDPKPMPSDSQRAFASMGNYIFNAELLVEELKQAKERGETDFGHHILPRLTESRRLYAYDFSSNRVPGLRDYEDQSYWRDVGTLEAYFDANRDILGLEPTFNLFNPRWPIYSSGYQGPVSKIVEGNISNSILGAGTLIKGASVKNSIIRREVVLEEDVEVEDCIIMDYTVVRRGARLKRVIVDRYNQIDPGDKIGFDRAADERRFHVSPSGIVVIPKAPYSAEISRYHG